MNAKNIKYTTLLCMLLACTAVKAETYHLTLEASVELAKEKSYTMLNLKENLKIAEYNLKSATASLKTHIDFSLTMPEFNQTVRTWDDTTGVYEFFLDAFRQQLYNIAPQIIGTGPLMVGWALQILNYLSNRSDFD